MKQKEHQIIPSKLLYISLPIGRSLGRSRYQRGAWKRSVLAGALASLLACHQLPTLRADDAIRVAHGLTIELVADDHLVPDCSTLACDPSGALAASGPGYIRRLEDRDGDGRYDAYTTLADDLSHGAHGLCFDGPFLYYVANNGVWQLELDAITGKPRSAASRVLVIQTGGEHHAHALRKGPDGHWYLMVGNGTRDMFDLQNSEQPPIARPRAGAIWKISSDWQTREVWAHGFRNAYDFDFAPDRSIVTFDSDGERDVSLPWYRPTRVYRLRQGNDAGWLSRSWKRPDYDPDMPEVLAPLGRGSPTGVMRYDQRRLPASFRDGTFVLDWTFGRLFFVSDAGTHQLVAEPLGTAGFAVTDIEALPDGRVAISVGGRGSRGGIYLLDAKQPGENVASLTIDWNREATPIAKTPIADKIHELRNRELTSIDVEAAQLASLQFEMNHRLHAGLIEAITLFTEALGGLGEALPSDSRSAIDKAAVFDSYRSQLAPDIPNELRSTFESQLVFWLELELAGTATLRTEAVRGLAVLESNSPAALAAIVGDMNRCEDPTDKLHRLFAIARLRSAFDEPTRAAIWQAMLDIPMRIEALGRKIDSNFQPRMDECFRALQHRDSRLAQQLVLSSEFGHPTHLVWIDAIPVELLESAIRRFLENDRSRTDANVARMIAVASAAVPRNVLDAWLANESTRGSAWLVIAQAPSPSDAEQLQAAASSREESVRKAAIAALDRLGITYVERRSSSNSTEQWLESAASIFQLEGDVEDGKSLFVSRQCANCHNATKALGPPLEGIAKRFGNQDLLRATVDPSHTIPDRYQAIQVLTHDGEIVTGIKVYESVDGVTLISADAQTHRINVETIAEKKISTKSLMPEGLLDELSPQQVADLIAFMRSL